MTKPNSIMTLLYWKYAAPLKIFIEFNNNMG